LKESGIKDDFSPAFLKQISHYIDDFRLLKNIYNEYLLYYEAIKETNIDKEKLFSLVTYKNIFPKDFNHLQYGKGYVYEIIQSKSYLIDQQTAFINKQICKNEKMITKIDSESIQEENELIALYVIPSFYHRKVTGYRYSNKTQITIIREF